MTLLVDSSSGDIVRGGNRQWQQRVMAKISTSKAHKVPSTLTRQLIIFLSQRLSIDKKTVPIKILHAIN